MELQEIRALRHQWPLPLAQVLLRTLNGKSPIERHNCAYYLGEAALKLATMARIGLWLQRPNPQSHSLYDKLKVLAMPSTGHWLGLLRDTNAALVQSHRDHPLLLGQSKPRRGDWEAVARFAEAAHEANIISKEVKRSASKGGVLPFFDLLVAYRNTVMGHASQRSNTFYEQMSPLLVAAVCEALSSRSLLGGAQLAVPLKVAGELQWSLLTGLAGMLSPELEGTAEANVSAGQLYMVGLGDPIGLHPVVVYRNDEDRRLEQVGFLNKTVRRTRKADDSRISEVSRSEHLDYATGEVVPGVDCTEALTAFLSSVGDRSLSATEFTALQAEQLVGTESQVTRVVATEDVFGDYEILGEVGRGAMGVVYKARQMTLGRTVALKIISQAFASDRTAEDRLKREVQALARCDHPNVVKVLTSGKEEGRAYFAMEYVDGADLSQAFEVLSPWQQSSRGALSEGHLLAALSSAGGRSPDPSEGEEIQADALEVEVPTLDRKGRSLAVRLAEVFADAAEGLHHIHEQGVVHRDLKPGNLMLTADGQRVVVMDLGLAKVNDASRALTTVDVKVLGTLRYMSPEQLQRNLLEVDARSDVYSLGVTLYELVTGHVYMDGDTEQRLIQQVLYEEPPSARTRNAGVPADLDLIISKATEKQADHRYATAQALADDLRAFSRGEPVSARPPSLIRKATGLARRHRSVAGGVLALVLVGAGWGLWQWDQQRVVIRWAADIEQRHGGWDIAHEISEADAERRFFAYRVQSRGSKVIRIDRMRAHRPITSRQAWNQDLEGNGEPALDPAPATLLQRWSGRRVHKIEVLDTHENLLHQISVEKGGVEGELRLLHRSATGFAQGWGSDHLEPGGGEVYGEIHTLDAEGRPLTKRWLGHAGQETRSEVGVWGQAYQRDEAHRMVSLTRLGADGNPAPDNDGMVTVRVSHDDARNPWSATRNVFLDATGQPTSRATVFGYEWEMDDRGNILSRTYLDAEGAPLTHAVGHARQDRVWDESGRLVKTIFLADGAPALDEMGCTQRVTDYDDADRPLTHRCQNADGGPAITQDGWSGWSRTYDAQGRIESHTWLDAGGEPTRIGDGGVAKQTYSYDDRGYWKTTRYHGPDESPMLRSDLGYAGIDRTVNANGQETHVRYVDLDDGLILTKDEGIAEVHYRINDRGQTEEVRYTGLNNEPVIDRTALWARSESRYDSHGNKEEERYFDAQDKLTPEKTSGCARKVWKWDDRGNQESESCYGPDKEPTFDRVYGVFQLRSSHDDHRNLIEGTYWDPSGAPMPNKWGVHRHVLDWSPRQEKLTESFFDTNGDLTTGSYGYAVERFGYDERGRETEYRRLDANNEPVVSDETGCVVLKKTYGARGWVVETACLGADDKPMVSRKWGYSKATIEHNSRGKETDTAFFDAEGAPAPQLETGCAGTKNVYDQRNNLTRTTCLGVDGQPIPQRDTGCATEEYAYTPRNRASALVCLDVYGARAMSTQWGGSAISKVYDSRGLLEQERRLDRHDRLVIGSNSVALTRWRYDALGRQSEIAYFDAQEQAVRPPAVGFHKYTTRYDANGRVEEERQYTGPDTLVQTSVMTAEGTHFVAIDRYAYDDRGNQTVRAYLDAQERPIRHPDNGCERVENIWNDKGLNTEVRCTDGAGELLFSNWGFARRTMAYDPRGREVETTTYGADGSQVPHGHEGWSHQVREYDAFDQVISQLKFTPDGSAIPDRESGCVQLRLKYDSQKNQRETSCHDLGGVLVPGAKGWALRRFEYDENNNPTAWAFFDAQEAPTMNTDGFARWEGRYSERNKLLEEFLLDTDGQPTTHRLGFARVTHQYDPDDRLLKQAHVDITGKPANGQDGWATLTRRYDAAGGLVSETYTDAEGEELDAAQVKRQTQLRESGVTEAR